MFFNYIKKVIQPYMNSFNTTEKKIAEYFINNEQMLINKTISELSADIGVSDSTIFKFVKKIGFDGFQDFKISLASNYKMNNDDLEDTKVFSDINKDDSMHEILKKVIMPKVFLLEYLLDTLDENLIEASIDLIHESKMIFFGGIGGSSVIAYDSYHKFLRTRYQCNYIADIDMQYTYAKKMNNNYLAFLFSHSGTTQETIDLAKSLKESGVKIISLTGNYGTTLEEISDITFVVSSDESTLKSETLTSRILYTTIMDILYIIIMYRDNEYNIKSLEAYQNRFS